MSQESRALDGVSPGGLDSSPGSTPNGGPCASHSMPSNLSFLRCRIEVIKGPGLLPGSG